MTKIKTFLNGIENNWILGLAFEDRPLFLLTYVEAVTWTWDIFFLLENFTKIFI